MEPDDDEFGISMPSSIAGHFRIGKGAADKMQTKATRPTASAVSRLPFGMGSLVQPKKRARPSSGAGGITTQATHASSSVPIPAEDHGDGDVSGSPEGGAEAPAVDQSASSAAQPPEAAAERMDETPLVLSVAAQHEWDNALAADEPISGDGEVTEATSGAGDRGTSGAGDRGVGHPFRRSAAKFHGSVGLQELSRVQRAGVNCLHCGLPVSKGDYRFVLCYRTSKPARSIHTTCLFQLQDECVENSIDFLRSKLQQSRGSLPADERVICQDALETLTASTAASSR